VVLAINSCRVMQDFSIGIIEDPLTMGRGQLFQQGPGT